MRRLESIKDVKLKVGLEVHVELSTRTKVFTGAPNPAAAEAEQRGESEDIHDSEHGHANTLIDPVVLGLPGALPVMNRAALEKSIKVGLAIGCSIAERTKWDRKSYFYPDLPKNYQISQYELPLCFDGAMEVPPLDAKGELDWQALCKPEESAALPRKRIGIVRAHLEEDAGKLLHELPSGVGSGGGVAGGASGSSYADYNRAGTPLLEIVTQPDFESADEVVAFAQLLRHICRFVGASEGVMQKGHMRFEPNINVILTLDDGRAVATPIVEVKNLNSFKAVRGAIEYELREQPARWVQDGREFGRGMKTTRGWDETANGGQTYVQREKEDADDYRYFPDPDLVPVVVDRAWREKLRTEMGEPSLARATRFIRDWSLSPADAGMLVDERAVCEFYESAVAIAGKSGDGAAASRIGKLAANMLLQSGLKRANERNAHRIRLAQERGISGAMVRPVLVSELGISAKQLAGIVAMREAGEISANAADELFGLLCGPEESPGESAGRGGSYPPDSDPIEVARSRGMLIVRDEGALDAWCAQAISENAKSAEDVKAGKVQAVGRIVGAAMKLAGGQADAAAVRAKILEKLGVQG